MYIVQNTHKNEFLVMCNSTRSWGINTSKWTSRICSECCHVDV